MENLLNKFDQPVYLEYNDVIAKLLDKNKNINIKKSGIIETKKRVIVLPKIQNVQLEIINLTKKKASILRDLYLMRNDMLSSDNIDTFKNKYEDIAAKIDDVDGNINTLQQYKINVNNKYYKSELDDLKQQYKRENIYSEKLKKYELVKHYNGLNIDFYIVEMPNIKEKNKTNTMQETDIDIEEPEPEPKAKQKPKPKIIKNKIEPNKILQIKSNVKKLLQEKFKFSSREECVSSKRSQAYFMSKKDLIEVIANNPEILNLVPSNYKTLSKDEICSYLIEK